MKSKRVAWTPVTGATNNICASQSPGAGAATLTINGALASGGAIPKQELGYIVGITVAATDLSGRTFTITGTSQDNAAQTEDVVGPSSNTVYSTKYYRSISSITVTAGTDAAITVGTSNVTLCAVTPTFPLNIYTPIHNIAVDVGGTINFTVEKCYERPTADETPNWVSHISAGTIDAATALTAPTGAVRVKVNTYTNTATFALQINPASYIRS